MAAPTAPAGGADSAALLARALASSSRLLGSAHLSALAELAAADGEAARRERALGELLAAEEARLAQESASLHQFRQRSFVFNPIVKSFFLTKFPI